jgi:diadenosine tetraphosphate (Ap4A) HIT family hydrolase
MKRPAEDYTPSTTTAAGPKRGRGGRDNGDDEEPPVVCLALPNFGPAEAVDEALQVLFECVGRFLDDPGTASTSTPSSPPVMLEIMVVEEAAGRYAERLRALAAAIPATTTTRRRFRLHLGRLTALKEETDSTVYAQAIAVPCDRRLLPSDHPVAATAFQKAGPILANTAKLMFHRAESGKAYPVKLMTPSSPLRAQQGVEFVLLALPPCQALATVLPEGWQGALRGTYEALLNAFVDHVVPKVAPRTKKLSVGDKKAASLAAAVPPPVEEDKDQGLPPPVPAYRHPGPPPQSASWHGGLIQYLQHATALKPFIFLETSQWMVIYDGYPKAKVHLLLLPKPSFLAVSGVAELRREAHGERLARLHVEARRIAAKLQQDMPGLHLRLGYHSVPSLQPLHLHIISQDFDSPSLKTKKHWNSFTTPFFLDTTQVETALQEQGRVVVDRVNAEALLKRPLRCHGCGAEQKNMPTLKQHLTRCRQVKELGTAIA